MPKKKPAPQHSDKNSKNNHKKKNNSHDSSESTHRPLWKGYVSFGLVNIPVTLVSADKPHEEIHFKLLDKTDLANIRYIRINAQTGKEVPWENIVKGYEYEAGNYAVLTEQDLGSIAIENLKTIEIEDFIDASALSSIYFEKPYYLLPDKRGEKGYVLLRETLSHTGKIGIARVMIRSHQYLAAIIPYGAALIINTIRYPEEIKIPEEIQAPEESIKHYKISKKEFEIAEQLVKTMSVEWDPSQYPNLFREDLIKLVEEKIKSGKKGVTKHIKGPVVKQTNVIDFMELLKKSVKEKQKSSSSSKGKGKH